MKNKNTALLLCIFGGPFGVHKFYERDVVMGLVYLCTAGLCFVGWWMDIIKYISMREEKYDAKTEKEEKRRKKQIKKEQTIIKKQEILRNRKCSKCGGTNYHAFVIEKEIVPEKRIMRHGINLNPLHPLTHTKTKEKVVQKRITKNISQFVCDDCGKIFD